MMKIRTFAALLAIAPLAACPGNAGPSSGPSPDATVTRLIAAAGQLARERGYSPSTTAPATGALNNGTQEDVGITLNQGREYLMVGMCDGDCSDMDLQLFDPSGNKIAEDVLDDDVPVLEFRAAASGNHRIRVVMARCSANPCSYGVSLYNK